MPRMSMIERETDRSTKLEQQLNEERNQHSKQLADQVKAFNDFRRMMQMNEEQQAQALKASADENAELKVSVVRCQTDSARGRFYARRLCCRSVCRSTRHSRATP